MNHALLVYMSIQLHAIAISHAAGRIVPRRHGLSSDVVGDQRFGNGFVQSETGRCRAMLHIASNGGPVHCHYACGDLRGECL